MTQYFVVAWYFVVTEGLPAPVIREGGYQCLFVKAETPEGALRLVASTYKYPFGLYAAACYADTDAYRWREVPLAHWPLPEAASEEKQAL